MESRKEHTSELSFSRGSRLFLVRSSCVLGKWNEEKASSKEAVSKWYDQEIGVREGLCFPRGNTTSTHLQHSGGPIISISFSSQGSHNQSVRSISIGR